jgi:diguanylate cyclase (GGDEF)-like protein/PAS domain S-box-containing protein
MIRNDRHYLYLIITITAFISGLIWLFIGENIVDAIVERGHAQQIYAYISGIMLMLIVFGILSLARLVLNYTGLIVDDETIQLTIYQSIVVEEADGIFFKDRRGYYRLMNDTAKQLLGLEGTDPIGNRDFQLFDAIMAHKIENEDRKILQFNETSIWEEQKNTGVGREVWLCRKMPCRTRKGQLIGIVGYCRNITVLKSFQNLNTDLVQRYQNLYDKLPYPALIMDALNMKPYSFNRAMTSLLGYSPHEFSDMRFNAHLSEESGENFIAKVSRLIASGGGEFEARLYTRDKDEVDVSGYAQALVIDDRKYLHMLLHDVTELLQSTEELIGSEMKYRSLFEHASDAILIIDIKTLRITDANDVAINYLGYRRNDLMQLTLLELEATGEQLETSDQLSNLEIYNHVTYEHVIRDRKGMALQVEINAHKVNYGMHQVYQFVIRDISLRKKTELALKESEQRYRQMFENNQAIKLVVDVNKYVIEAANLAAARFYGYQQNEMPGMSLDKINIMSRDKILTMIRQSNEQNMGYYTCPHRLASGDIRFVEVRDGVMEIGGQSLLYSIIYDVTETRRAENQLLLASKMFDCTTDAVMITDRNNQVISINQAFTDLTGFQLSEIINTDADDLLTGRDQKFITRDVIASLQQHGSWQGDICQRLLNGKSGNLRATINVVMNRQGEIINHIIMMSTNQADVKNEKLGENYAGLTGLPNLAIFVSQMRQAIDRSQRSHKQVAVLLLDVRNFSDINKAKGREAGNQILKAMARRLKHNVRESDTVAHFEKDNFAVLLEDLADVQQTGIVAQKILTTLGEEYQIDGDEITLEISIGISVSPEDGIDEVELLEKAEYALVAAQQVPGNSFRLCSQHMNNSAWQWLQTDESMHGALKNNEFIVSYLPQISLIDYRVEAVEALVRWNTPQGVLMPLRFLPNAEQSGFISAIGNKVIEVACADYGGWHQQGVRLDYLVLNLSPAQIVEDLEFYLLEQCKNNGLTTDSIILDFNEQKFIVSSTEQRNILRSLQARGFRVCVDDFGSGHASLSCLLQCPVNVIKIDRAFTSTCIESIESQNMVSGVLALATKLDMLVVAEGVETQEEYERLRALGCTHMQGFYFSEPLRDTQVKSFVTEFGITQGEK